MLLISAFLASFAVLGNYGAIDGIRNSTQVRHPIPEAAYTMRGGWIDLDRLLETRLWVKVLDRKGRNYSGWVLAEDLTELQENGIFFLPIYPSIYEKVSASGNTRQSIALIAVAVLAAAVILWWGGRKQLESARREDDGGDDEEML